MKLLIFIPSPRDLEEFSKAMDAIEHDKIWMKYMPYSMAPYEQARAYFLRHKEYTHFAICPDDLIVTKEGVEKLWQTAQTGKIIGGVCNVSLEDLNRGDDMELAITHNLPSGERGGRVYKFYKREELPKNKIITVPWSGTAFMILPRRILKEMPLTGDARWNNGNPFSFDVGIAHWLAEHSITQYIDTSVFFRHFRFFLAKHLGVGVYEPDIWFDFVGCPRLCIHRKQHKPHFLPVKQITQKITTQHEHKPAVFVKSLNSWLCKCGYVYR